MREIADRVGVSQASASVWVRDIRLTASQRRALDERGERGRAHARERRSERARARRRTYQDEGRLFARERGARYAAGCMLYWAEGAKQRNTLRLTNSDPELLAFFAGFLEGELGVPRARMKLACNLFADHLERQREIENYWLAKLGLPSSSLRKSTVNVFSKYSEKKRIGRLPFGTAALHVDSTRIVQTVYGSIQEFGASTVPSGSIRLAGVQALSDAELVARCHAGDADAWNEFGERFSLRLRHWRPGLPAGGARRRRPPARHDREPDLPLSDEAARRAGGEIVSSSRFDTIVSRAASDGAFRARLLANLEAAALEEPGYEATPSVLASLRLRLGGD